MPSRAAGSLDCLYDVDRLVEPAEELERLGAMEGIAGALGLHHRVFVAPLLDELLHVRDRLLRDHVRDQPADQRDGDQEGPEPDAHRVAGGRWRRCGLAVAAAAVRRRRGRDRAALDDERAHRLRACRRTGKSSSGIGTGAASLFWLATSVISVSGTAGESVTTLALRIVTN